MGWRSEDSLRWELVLQKILYAALYMELKKSTMEAESDRWLTEAGRQHGKCRSENTTF